MPIHFVEFQIQYNKNRHSDKRDVSSHGQNSDWTICKVMTASSIQHASAQDVNEQYHWGYTESRQTIDDRYTKLMPDSFSLYTLAFDWFPQGWMKYWITWKNSNEDEWVLKK